MIWKKIKKFLPIIGIGIFIYLILKLDFIKIFQEIKTLNIPYLLIAIFLVFVFLTSQTFKWFIIARKQKIKIPFFEAFKINLISNFYGFITPSKIGSIIRINYIKKYSGEIGKSISNFVIDKIFDISSLFVFVIIFGFLFYTEMKIMSLNSLYLFLIIFLMIIFIFLLFYKKKSSQFILGFFYKRFIPHKIKEKARGTFNSFYENIPSLSFLLIAFFFNIVSWLLDYLAVYFVGLSLGINVGFWVFLAILPISTLVGQIPVTIGGLGTRELVLINLFGLFGVGAVKIFSMSLVTLIINSIIPSIIGSILSLKQKG